MREPTLDPVRRPRLPRGRTLLRTGLVATFLLTAVAALLAPDPAPAPCAPAPSAGASAPSVAPSAPSADASGRLTVPPGAVGVPVRLAEPAVLALVHPGDRVDLLAAGRASPASAILARDALVLAVVGADGAVLLALGPERARAIVGLPDGTRFGLIVRPK
jgi:hypothetical protein